MTEPVGRRWWLPAILAAATWLACLPCLASSPQNPDGAELVVTALHWGVPHAPGYPLQSWLDHLAVLLPWGTPAHRLSLLSSVMFALAALVLAKTLLERGATAGPTALGVAMFALYPPAWYIGVQPEKYAGALLLEALILRWALSPRESPGTRRDAAWLGLLWGLTAAQHPLVAALLLPYLVLHMRGLARPRGGSGPRVMVLGASAVVVTIGLYASLFLVRQGAVWPDWGKIASVSDLWRLASRSDFGLLMPKGISVDTEKPARAISLLVGEYGDAFRVLGVLPVIGLLALLRARRLEGGLVGISLALSLAFLSVATHSDRLSALAYLERFSLPLVLQLALLAGLGTQALLDWVPKQVARPAQWAAIALVPILFLGGFRRADASSDSTLDQFREGLAQALPASAFYFLGTDVEPFYGVPQAGHLRFPILGDFPWSGRVNPLIEPRLASLGVDPGSGMAILSAAYASGATLASSRPEVFETLGVPVHQWGMVYRVGKAERDPTAAEWASLLAGLCGVMTRPPSRVPAEGHFYSRFLLPLIAQGFSGAIAPLSAVGDREGAGRARSAAEAILDGDRPDDLERACAGLEGVR